MEKIKTIFCGNPDFALATLESLHDHPRIDLQCVVTNADKPVGRGKKLSSPPCAQFAKENKIPLFQTNNINQEDSLLDELENNRPELIIVVAFSHFLGKRILDLPTVGPFNIHASLLPQYRGAAPIQYSLLNGDTQTGVSIQKMIKQMDAGDIVKSKHISIQENDTSVELYSKLKTLAVETLNEFIQNVLENNIIATKQPIKGITFAPIIKKQDGFIDFKNETFTQIKNKIKAFHPWPGCFCHFNNHVLKIFSINKESLSLNPGEFTTEYHSLVIGVKDCAIRLLEVQLPGKNRCSDSDLLRGIQDHGNIKINNKGTKK